MVISVPVYFLLFQNYISICKLLFKDLQQDLKRELFAEIPASILTVTKLF